MERLKSEQTKLRNAALYESYKNALRSSKCITHQQAVRMALNAPQARLWVPFYCVYRILLRFTKRQVRPPKRSARQALLYEVITKYDALRNKRQFKDAPLSLLASFVIAEPSNGFYISEAQAERIIRSMRKKQQTTWIKKQ